MHTTSSWLESYRPAAEAEQRDRQRMLELAARGAEAYSRRSFTPGHFTASAFVVSPERDALLLIFHPKLARWLQPGGHVEPTDADLEAAARREAEEETGLTQLTALAPGIFDVDIHEIPARKDEPAHLHFDVRFAFLARTRTLTLGGDGIDRAQWVPLAEVTAERSDASVARAAAKLRSTR